MSVIGLQLRDGTPEKGSSQGERVISPPDSAVWGSVGATDALGRELPTYEEVGDLKPDRYVGLFYWLWHTPLRNDTPDFDLTEILKKDPYRTHWPHLAYYWGQPELGYYRSSDEYVLQKHLNLFCLLGIDFLYLDFTNLVMDRAELHLLLRLIGEMKANGYTPPRLVPFFNTNPVPRLEEFYSEFYCDTTYRDAWFVLDGEAVGAISDASSDKRLDQRSLYVASGCGPGVMPTVFGTISNDYPQTPAYREDGTPEQIVVSAGKGAPLWDYHIYGAKSLDEKLYARVRFAVGVRPSGRRTLFRGAVEGGPSSTSLILCVTGLERVESRSLASDKGVGRGEDYVSRALPESGGNLFCR